MTPMFHAPAVDRATATWFDAERILTDRTGREFFPSWRPGDRCLIAAGKPRRFDPERHVSEEEVRRDHPDLMRALNLDLPIVNQEPNP